MAPVKYMRATLEGGDGTLFVVLESGAGWELRGRRAGDRIRLETWNRVESVEVSAEAVSAIHALVGQQLPREGES